MATQFPYTNPLVYAFISPEVKSKLLEEYTKPLPQIEQDLLNAVQRMYLVKYGDPVRHDDHNTILDTIIKVYAAAARIADELKSIRGAAITLNESVNPTTLFRAACLDNNTEFCDFLDAMDRAMGYIVDDFRMVLSPSYTAPVVAIGTKDFTTIKTTCSEAQELGIDKLVSSTPSNFPYFFAAAVKINDFQGSDQVTIMHVHADRYLKAYYASTNLGPVDVYIYASPSGLRIEALHNTTVIASSSIDIDLTKNYVVLAVTAKPGGVSNYGGIFYFDYFKVWVLGIPYKVLSVIDLTNYFTKIQIEASQSSYYPSLSLWLFNSSSSGSCAALCVDWVASYVWSLSVAGGLYLVGGV